MAVAKKKVILFGGTFDPIHIGHTDVAVEAAEHIGAEKIIFVPAKRSPLKGTLPKAGGADRFAMIALAIADNKKFELSDYEMRSPEPSYTLQTVRQFQADYGSNTLIYWLVGADSIDDLSHWYGITELIDRCNLSVMYRAGYNPPDFTRFQTVWGPRRVEKLQQNIIQTSLIDISSTEIRNRIATGQEVADMLHPLVADYIHKHNLYKSDKTE